jgi:hypothetical protein
VNDGSHHCDRQNDGRAHYDVRSSVLSSKYELADVPCSEKSGAAKAISCDIFRVTFRQFDATVVSGVPESKSETRSNGSPNLPWKIRQW